MEYFGLFLIVSAWPFTSQTALSTGPVVRVLLKPDGPSFGNDTVESDFSLNTEILNAIHNLTGLNFQVTQRPDLLYGTPNSNGSWDGTLIGSLLDNEADLVGPDLTRTVIGEKVVDFLAPVNPYKLQVIYNTAFGLRNDTQYAVAYTEDMNYLKTTQNPDAKAAWASIQAGLPDSILPETSNGEDTVLSGNFAVVVESESVGQILQNNAGNISLAPGDLGGPFYLGMAVQQGSYLREPLDMALLQITESGLLEQLIKKYKVWTL